MINWIFPCSQTDVSLQEYEIQNNNNNSGPIYWCICNCAKIICKTFLTKPTSVVALTADVFCNEQLRNRQAQGLKGAPAFFFFGRRKYRSELIDMLRYRAFSSIQPLFQAAVIPPSYYGETNWLNGVLTEIFTTLSSEIVSANEKEMEQTRWR